MERHGDCWKIVERYENNNGLVVLKRLSTTTGVP
jgi:hypothetical protein